MSDAPAVLCEDLGLRLGEHQTLEHLDLRFAAGSSCAIVGPNGAGKSSLLRVLLGLLPPSSGRAQVLGKPAGATPAAWIGYVPQVKTLDRRFPALPIELVATGCRPRWPWRLRGGRRERAEAALREVGMEALAQRPLARLSGGELQRVYLARALVREPRLILLDEPATGMDLSAEADMYDILESYQRRSGATVVMVTHDWGAAQHHADTVLVLHRRLIALDTPEAALTEEHLSRAFGHLGHDHHMHPGSCEHGDGEGHA